MPPLQTLLGARAPPPYAGFSPCCSFRIWELLYTLYYVHSSLSRFNFVLSSTCLHIFSCLYASAASAAAAILIKLHCPPPSPPPGAKVQLGWPLCCQNGRAVTREWLRKSCYSFKSPPRRERERELCWEAGFPLSSSFRGGLNPCETCLHHSVRVASCCCEGERREKKASARERSEITSYAPPPPPLLPKLAPLFADTSRTREHARALSHQFSLLCVCTCVRGSPQRIKMLTFSPLPPS